MARGEGCQIEKGRSSGAGRVAGGNGGGLWVHRGANVF